MTGRSTRLAALTGAAGLLTGAVAAGAALRRRDRPPSPPHDLDSTDHPTGLLRVDVDGQSLGLAVAILSERYGLSQREHAELRNTLPPDPAHGPSGDPDGAVEDYIVASYAYTDILRSVVATAQTLSIGMVMSQACPPGCACGTGLGDDGTLLVDAARYLIDVARSFAKGGYRHARDCAWCASLGADAPAFVRARFCTDLATDLIASADSRSALVSAVPLEAAFDAMCVMFDLAMRLGDSSPAEEIGILMDTVAVAFAAEEAPG